MSLLQDIVGSMLGGVASAIVGALESLARERDRAITGGFVDEILALTALQSSDVNPVIVKLLDLQILKQRGHSLLELCPPLPPNKVNAILKHMA